MRSTRSKTLFLGLFLAGCGTLAALGQVNIPLLTYSNSWRIYTQNSTLPPNQGTLTWKTNGYADTTWTLAGAPFGYPTDEALLEGIAVNTALNHWTPAGNPNIITTYYFRATCNFPNPVTPGVSLTFRNQVDDGAIVYLNGVEQYRVGMAAGVMNPYSFSGGRGDDITGHGVDVVTIGSTNLKQGVNVVAVEYHQVNATSSDEIMAISLTATGCVRPTITNCPPNQVLAVGGTLNIDFRNVIDGGCAPSYLWYRGIPGSATYLTQGNQFYSVIGVTTNHSGNYFMIASNVVGATTSCVVNVQVLSDIFPPGIVSAVAQEASPSNTIMVTFTESMNFPTASKSNNYVITRMGTTNRVMVNKVVAQQAQALLTVDTINWRWGSNYILMVKNVTDSRGNSISTYSNQAMVTFFKDLLPINADSKSFDYRFLPIGQEYMTNLNWTLLNYDDNDGYWTDWGGRGPYYFDGAPPTTLCDGLDLANFTVMNQVAPDVVTHYFRTPFVAPTNTGRAIIQLQPIIDDGAIFYLNGTEVWRYNMTTGPFTPTTPALSDIDPATACPDSTNIVVNTLRSGTNMLAVEVHQSTSTTTYDVYYGVKIRAGITEAIPSIPPLKLTRTTVTGMPTNTVANTHVRLSWNSTNTPGWLLQTTTNLFSTNVTWVTVATNSPHTTNVTGRAAYYYNLIKPVP